MKKVLFIFIAICPWLSAFGQDAVMPADMERSVDAPYGDENVVAGLVRIKVVPETPPLPVGSFPCGEARTGDAELDAVLTRIGATAISRVFGDGGRFAERRRRYGLHLWYEIAISEPIPVDDAIEALEEVEIIEYAGPVYRITLSEGDSGEEEYDEDSSER